jgi:hypothetical protein
MARGSPQPADPEEGFSRQQRQGSRVANGDGVLVNEPHHLRTAGMVRRDDMHRPHLRNGKQPVQ